MAPGPWAADASAPPSPDDQRDASSAESFDTIRPTPHPRLMARILVVDDEPHIVDVVSAYLVREGHVVSTASDGEAALVRARADPPDLIVLDVMLPLRSGFDVLRDLRAAGSSAAVILLTARRRDRRLELPRAASGR